jgi:Flavin containing amine oxidoreductase
VIGLKTQSLQLCMQAETDDDAEIAAAAMAVLRQVHGAGIPEPTAVHVSRWGSDPYSLGGSQGVGRAATWFAGWSLAICHRTLPKSAI